jgi:hypothetical protein
MITWEDAALRAELILEFPADDPEYGWELEEFPQGWLVIWYGGQGHPGQFCIVIERETGLVRYFTTFMPTQAIISEYESVRDLGRLDDRWTEQPTAPTGGREPAVRWPDSARAQA